MKKIILLFAIYLVTNGINAQQKKIWNETKEEKTERLAWWINDRFGMFIHWRSYSLECRHEWVKKYEVIGDATYKKYFDNFNPDLYNPIE